MRTIEIDDAVQARRCRFAQYNARLATLTVAGMTITGKVLSVMEDRSIARWTVKIAEQANPNAWPIDFRGEAITASCFNPAVSA